MCSAPVLPSPPTNDPSFPHPSSLPSLFSPLLLLLQLHERRLQVHVVVLLCVAQLRLRHVELRTQRLLRRPQLQHERGGRQCNHKRNDINGIQLKAYPSTSTPDTASNFADKYWRVQPRFSCDGALAQTVMESSGLKLFTRLKLF